MLKGIVRATSFGALFLGLASSAFVEEAHAETTQSVTLSSLGPLVPTNLVRGDREFDGGPDITSRVTLRVSPDQKSIMAKVFYQAEETKGDHTTVRQEWDKKVYDAPAGKKILGIEGQTTSEVHFRGRNAGFQILGPGEDFKEFARKIEELVNAVLNAENQLSGRNADTPEERRAREIVTRLRAGAEGMQFEGNYVHTVTPQSGPVALFSIVGDTGGDDVSKDENGKDDTRIVDLRFKHVRIRMQ